jgi:hypothetical protein
MKSKEFVKNNICYISIMITLFLVSVIFMLFKGLRILLELDQFSDFLSVFILCFSTGCFLSLFLFFLCWGIYELLSQWCDDEEEEEEGDEEVTFGFTKNNERCK